MKSSRYVKVFVVLGFVLCMPILFAGETMEAQREPKLGGERPNIVFILSDDMREDEMMRVSRLASLARSGTTFENSFVTNSLCCPSRATALRGQYSHNHKVFTNHPPLGSWTKFQAEGYERSTLPKWLRSSGYKTGFFGRYLNKYNRKEPPPGWDYWVQTRALTPAANVNGDLKKYPKNTYGDDIAGREAAKFVGINDSKKPIFVALWFRSPHPPYKSPRRYAHRHNNVSFDKSPSFNETDVSDKPEWVRNLTSSDKDSWEKIKNDKRTRLEMLEAVANNINRVRGTLKKKGELDNTYFIFTSDNGYLLGEHRDNGKKSAYEESIRVPLSISGPNVPRGVIQDELVTNNDLAPTILDLAGVRQRKFFDGRSLVPLLRAGDDPEWRKSFLIEHWKDFSTSIPTYKAVRTEDAMYVEYKTGEKELYDLETDSYQLDNLAGKESTLEAKLSEKLETLRSCSGKSCHAAENAAP